MGWVQKNIAGQTFVLNNNTKDRTTNKNVLSKHFTYMNYVSILPSVILVGFSVETHISSQIQRKYRHGKLFAVLLLLFLQILTIHTHTPAKRTMFRIILQMCQINIQITYTFSCLGKKVPNQIRITNMHIHFIWNWNVFKTIDGLMYHIDNMKSLPKAKYNKKLWKKLIHKT